MTIIFYQRKRKFCIFSPPATPERNNISKAVIIIISMNKIQCTRNTYQSGRNRFSFKTSVLLLVHISYLVI